MSYMDIFLKLFCTVSQKPVTNLDRAKDRLHQLCGLRGLVEKGNMSTGRVKGGREVEEMREKKFKRVPVEGGAVGIADGQERRALGIVVERGIDELGGRVKSMRQRRSSLPRGDLLGG